MSAVDIAGELFEDCSSAWKSKSGAGLSHVGQREQRAVLNTNRFRRVLTSCLLVVARHTGPAIDAFTATSCGRGSATLTGAQQAQQDHVIQ